jgi:hypothetical protein
MPSIMTVNQLPLEIPGPASFCREKLFRKARPIIITIVPGEDDSLARNGFLAAFSEQ